MIRNRYFEDNQSSGMVITRIEDLSLKVMQDNYRTNYYSIIYVTDGSCVHEIDYVTYKVRKAEALIVSNNRLHSFDYTNKSTGYVLMFTEGFLCEFLSHQSSGIKDLFKVSYLMPLISNTGLYESIITKCFQLIESMYKQRSQILDEEIIASGILSLGKLIKNCMTDKRLNHKNKLFVDFTDLIEKHYVQEKSVEAYAKMLHVSVKTVNQATRKAVDMSAKQYIIKQIIQKIRLKLSYELKSISEIAYELGFSEASNMTRFFIKYTGESPKVFRESINGHSINDYRRDTFDLSLIKGAIERRVYHIQKDTLVPLHAHTGYDEVFYCVKGSGYSIYEKEEVPMEVGDTFVAKAGVLHALGSKTDLYVASFLIPVINKR